MTPGLLIAITIAAAHLDPGDVVWLRKPTGEEISRHIPTDVRDLTGRVILDCAVTTSGQLSDCRVTGDDSADQTLSGIAIKFAPYYRAALHAKSGVPVAGRRVTIPYRFDPPSDEPSATQDPASE
jgi:hypothetical protein